MQSWQERMVEEYKDLSDKISKGTVFLCSEKMTATERNMLRSQLAAMNDYHAFLQARLDYYALIY